MGIMIIYTGREHNTVMVTSDDGIKFNDKLMKILIILMI